MTHKQQHIVIVGATSAMAEHCARLWVAASPKRLTLIGRDAQRLARVADDLKVRSPASHIDTVAMDLTQADAIDATVATLSAQQAVDVALIAHGVLSDQLACQNDVRQVAVSMQVNAVSPVLWAEAFVQRMVAAQHGTVAVIGSVAGDRGRQSNYVYGAAKGLVARYMQGMQHRLAGSQVKAVLIKPGPTATPMTAALSAQGQKMASVEQVAADIVRGIARGQAVVYTPGIWRFIMLVVMHIPRVVFDRIRL
jgi:short-subunit dehydrogenase